MKIKRGGRYLTKRKLGQRLRTLFLAFVILLGIALIFNKPIRNMIIAWNTNQYQVSHVSKKTIDKNKSATVSYDFDAIEPISTESILKAQTESANLPVIGGIAIPDLGINLPVFKGLGNTELSYGAGTMKENQVMGGDNNYALASHHVFGLTGSSKMLFSPLEQAKDEMLVYLTDKEKIYTYVINSVEQVMPEDVAVIDDTDGQKELTLVTCTDAAASSRIIVKAIYQLEVPFDDASEQVLKAFSASYNVIS